MDKKEPLYGVSAGAEGKLLLIGKNTITLQPILFWVLSYVVSVVIFLFFKSYIPLLNILNVVLFPFAVMLIGDIAIKFTFSFPLLYGLLYPTYKDYVNSHNTFIRILIIVLKIGIYIVVWRYTFILGVIGLMIKISHTQKMI